LAFGFEKTHLSTVAGVSMVVGTWVMGSITCMQDFSRFVRSPKAAGTVSALGIFIANSFCLMIGGVGAATAGRADPAQILLSVGLLVPAILFSIASVWTTNDDNIYSASLNAATLLGVSRRSAVLICTLSGALVAVFEPYRSSFLFVFLNFLGTTAPPLGAIVLLRFWCFRAGDAGKSSLAAWIAWGGGVTAGHFIHPEVGFVSSLLVGGAVYLVAMLSLNKSFVFADGSQSDGLERTQERVGF
jgi:cytosine permease